MYVPLEPQCPGFYPRNLDEVEVLFVAEAPGRQEVLEHKPLVGSAGKVLWKAMHESGFASVSFEGDKYTWAYGLNLRPINGVALDNVVHCYPGNRPPTYAERIHCARHLGTALTNLKNLRLIVALGDTAFNHFTNESKILKRRGMPIVQFIPALGREVPLLPMLHPSFILRQRQWYDTFVRDLRKAYKMWKEGFQPYEVEALDLDEEAVRELLRTGFAFDIETTGFSFIEEKIIGCSFSNGRRQAWHAWYDKPHEWQLAVRLLESDAYKIAQNGCFDVPFLKAKGVRINKVEYDTCYAQHLISPELPSNLAFISSLYTNSPYYKEQRDELIAGRLTHAQIKQYCCNDSEVTYSSFQKQRLELAEDQELTKVFNTIVMPSTKVANNLILKGVKIDLEEIEKVRTNLQSIVLPIREVFDNYGVNLNAPAQVKQLLTTMKMPVADTSAETLLKLYKRTNHPLIPSILKYKKYNKVLSTFIDGLSKRLDPNGFLHTSYRVDGTKNSRWSSKKPNLQNIPPEVRKLFIPSAPGKIFVQADYSRLELFVAGVLSEDSLFLHDVETTPIHDVMAEELFGASYTKHQRLLAKTVIFGTIYGRSARSIAIAFGISVADAERIQHTVARKYLRLTAWTKISLMKLKQDGYLRSAFGRIRYFDEGNLASDAANYPVQTAAGDITNTSLILLDDLLDLRLTVHDSIVAECYEHERDQTAKTLQSIMSRPIPELKGYQFPVSVEYGPTWGDLTEWVPSKLKDETDIIDQFKTLEEEDNERN
jgi:DNA polymerase-1